MTADSTPSPPSDEPTAAVDREESVLDDLVAGGIFVALGLAFAIGARGYELGSAFRMGPGYVPLVLGGVLTLLGMVVIGAGVLRWRASDKTPTESHHGAVPWRAIALLTAAVFVFGAGVFYILRLCGKSPDRVDPEMHGPSHAAGINPGPALKANE